MPGWGFTSNRAHYAGAVTLRIGFAVPMVLVLGLLPLARHFATVGAPE